MSLIIGSTFSATDVPDAMILISTHQHTTFITYFGKGAPVSTLKAFVFPLYLVTKIEHLFLRLKHLTFLTF